MNQNTYIDFSTSFYLLFYEIHPKSAKKSPISTKLSTMTQVSLQMFFGQTRRHFYQNPSLSDNYPCFIPFFCQKQCKMKVCPSSAHPHAKKAQKKLSTAFLHSFYIFPVQSHSSQNRSTLFSIFLRDTFSYSVHSLGNIFR